MRASGRCKVVHLRHTLSLPCGCLQVTVSVSQLSSITSGLSQTSTALQSQLSTLTQQQASDVYSLTSQLNAQASTLQSQLSAVAQTLNQNVSSIDALVQASATSPVPVQACHLCNGASLLLSW